MRYSLIIIGAGITGLSTALAWTKVFSVSEKPVLILEKNPIPGGCVTTFARQGFRFDTTQIIPDISNILQFFELEIPLVKFENFYARLFRVNEKDSQVEIVEIPSSVKNFEQMMIGKFPDEKVKIQAFFNYCMQMHDELRFLKTEPKWYQIPRVLMKCQKIIANSNKTYHQFLERFDFKNQEIIQILDTFSSFSGLSGNRCAALLTTCAMITTLKGSYRPVKGFIQFPVAISEKLKSVGVKIKTNCCVSKIIIENNRVKGVQTAGGEIFESDYVVSTADTKLTFGELIGNDNLNQNLNRLFKKVHKIQMSPSGFSIQLGIDDKIDLNSMGFNCGYNVLTSGIDAHIRMFDSWENGELLMSDDCFHLAVICPSLMTGGKQTIIIHVVPVPAEKWINLRDNDYSKYFEEKNRVAQFYIRKVEQFMIPDLTRHIVFTDVSTPATYKRYIGSPTGSQYDMLPVPSNFGKNRLPTRTPVKNLFVPKFSHGIWPSLQAGIQVVDMISGGRIMNGNSSLS